MRIVKGIGIVTGILLLLLLGAAVILPVIFKDDLIALAKNQINERLDADVEFEDISLSLFRDFPDLSLSVEKYAVNGRGPFEGVALITGDAFDITLDLWSVLSSSRPIELESITLRRPDLHVYVLKNGRANYDILKSSTEATTGAAADPGQPVEISLRSYGILNGRLLYDDHASDTYLLIEGLQHRGAGNFSDELFDLDTETAIDAMTLRQGGMTYLRAAEAALEAVFNIDQSTAKYTLKNNDLRINALRLQADGYVQLDGDDYRMDLNLAAPGNEFKDLLSLIPNAYIADYQAVQADGTFRFDSDIEGTYNGEQERYPAFAVDLEVDNGSVQYPGLPLAITSIRTRASIESPGSDFDDIVVDVPALHFQIGEHPFDARLHLETPLSDPAVDGAVDGTIDLGELSRAFPMEGIEVLTGRIVADIAADTRLSYVESGAYEKVDMRGDLLVSDLRYQGADMPLVAIEQARVDFTPRRVNIQSFNARLGNSDLQASGAIDNILAYLAPDRTMTGQLTLRSGFFDVNEWLAASEPEAAEERLADTTTAEEAIFDRFRFDIDAEAETIDYDTYRLSNTSARATLQPNQIDIEQATTRIGESDFELRGAVNNAFDYTFADGILGGRLILRSKKLNLNEFMSQEAQAPATASPQTGEDLEPIRVPANIRLDFDVDIKELLYTNILLRNLSGQVRVADESAMIENARADALGGRIAFIGAYDTQDPAKPAFNLKFDLNTLDFREAFTTVNTFQALAPIGRFISGNFNSTLIMDGYLTADLMPEFSTLNAEGFLQTFDATISSIKPLEKIGRKLNISQLTEQWRINDSKNWFEVKNGMVEVKPFDINIKGIPMTVSGRHGLDVTTMDYAIQASIPRELLRQGNIGQAADAGLSFLQQQAGQLGINFQQGDHINVAINLTGNMKDPNVGLQLLGTGGASSLQEQATAGIVEEAEKQLEAGKELAGEKARELVDSAGAVAQEQIDRAVDKLKQEAEKKLEEQGKDLTKELEKTAGELLDSTTTKTVDQIQKELEKWNPFRKKTPPSDTTKTSSGGN